MAPSDLEPRAVALIDGVLSIGAKHKHEPRWRIATWIPDEPETIPFVVMPADEPPQFDVPAVTPVGHLDPGITYAWIGCQGCARFDDFGWHIESITENAAEILAESGAVGPPSCGGAPSIYGTVELVDSSRIEWSIPGYGPIAILRSRESSIGWAC